MKPTSVLALIVAGALIVGGCEEKTAPNTPPANTGKSMTDSVTDAAKDAAGKTGEAVKDAANKATEKVKEGAAAITDQAKKAMSDYMAGLGDANSAMEKIKSALDIPGNMAAINDAGKKIMSNSAILGALPDSEKSALKTENSSMLDSLTAKFKEQLDRLMKDPTLSKVGESLKSIKLFE